MPDTPFTWEPLGAFTIALSQEHRFGTDALLLAHFSAPRSGERVCDLGTGCGILPLLFAQRPVPPKHIVGVELQAQAVALFSRSIEENHLADRISVRQADLRQRSSLPAAAFDRVTCNPPYFSPDSGQVSQTPAAQTARHEGYGCTLPDVVFCAAHLLRFGGAFCLCHRPDRLCDLLSALREAGLEPKKLCFVQNRPDKAPWLCLCEARKGGKPGLTVSPPLVLYEQGRPTAIQQAIYAPYLAASHRKREPRIWTLNTPKKNYERSQKKK